MGGSESREGDRERERERARASEGVEGAADEESRLESGE